MPKRTILHGERIDTAESTAFLEGSDTEYQQPAILVIKDKIARCRQSFFFCLSVASEATAATVLNRPGRWMIWMIPGMTRAFSSTIIVERITLDVLARVHPLGYSSQRHTSFLIYRKLLSILMKCTSETLRRCDTD